MPASSLPCPAELSPVMSLPAPLVALSPVVSASPVAAVGSAMSDVTTFVWVCDASGCLVSDPSLWSNRFQLPLQTVSGRAWLHQLHPDDQTPLLNCLMSALPLCGTDIPADVAAPRSLMLRFRSAASAACYEWYRVEAVPVVVVGGHCYWFFLSTSLEPTAADYAERNLLSVMTMAISLSQTVLASLTALHHETLRPPLCRRLRLLTDQIHGYLEHVEQGVRHLTQQRSRP